MKYTFKYILPIIFTLITLECNAQSKLSTKSKKAIKYFTEAELAYRNYEFNRCLEQLDFALSKDSKFMEAYFLKAEVYNKKREFKLEAQTIEQTIKINPNYYAYQYYNYAEALLKSGQYSKSKENFNTFLAKKIVKPHIQKQAKTYIDMCNYAIELKNNPVKFNPINIGEAINNSKDQYWPSLSIDGKTMVYTELQVDSTRKTMFGNFAHQEDFYISHFFNGLWSKGTPIGPPINTPGNEGAQQLSADGKTLVFTGCNRSKGYGLCDIYFSHLTPNGWSNPENAGKIINTQFSEKQPCLSADGRSLYFSSNRKGTEGGMDLYVSHKNSNDEWSKPINLGKTINTPYDDISPYIHPDNKTLYFSSEGHPGMGQCDIFISRKNDSLKWSEPENLGYPINSHKDEIGLITDNLGEKAYFSSNIEGNSRNIYFFDLPEKAKPKPVSYITGIVRDKKTRMPIKANIELLMQASADTIMFLKSDSLTGSYLLCLPSGNNYAINVNQTGYLFFSKQFVTNSSNTAIKPLKMDIDLVPVKLGESIVLENIFFKSDSYELLLESTAELIKIFEFLTDNNKLNVEISGHTDNSGNTDYNQKLSENRAKSVYSYLLSKGISENRLNFKGYGETIPIAPNNSEENKAKNRRTELKILN